MKRLADYFNILADRIEIDARSSGLASHNADIGTNRERIVELFLSKHLPRRLRPFLVGTIFGLSGQESKQIDIIISNDLAMNFEEHSKMFIAAESVAVAITVKSYLDKDAIHDCLGNLASVPQLSSDVLKFKLLKPTAFQEFSNNHPAFYVFAFDGVSAETCIKHVLEFYNNNQYININRMPIGITINKRYYIRFSPHESFVTTGMDIVPPRTFHASVLEDKIRGYPLAQIVNRITDYTDWLPFMTVHNNVYLADAYGLPRG
jgi:hypothetical protein